MILLSLTTIDRQQAYRDFYCWFELMEEAFDVVNGISRRGDRIISVVINDDDHSVSLPVDAFDGTPCSGIIQGLEHEWRQVLC